MVNIQKMILKTGSPDVLELKSPEPKEIDDVSMRVTEEQGDQNQSLRASNIETEAMIDALKKRVGQEIKNHPDLELRLMDIYRLAMDEISEGNSAYHECELALDDIDDLIEKKQKQFK